jgi:hypothetical protein
MSRRGMGGCHLSTALTTLRLLLAGLYAVGAPEAAGECCFHGLLRKCDARLCFEHFLCSLSKFCTSLCFGLLGCLDVFHLAQTTAATHVAMGCHLLNFTPSSRTTSFLIHLQLECSWKGRSIY